VRDPNLDTAIRLWRSNRVISLVLASKLIAAGYDVARLEARYSA
jgi:hypothetical protein